MKIQWSLAIALMMGLMGLMGASLNAQQFKAAVTGTVTDGHGGVLPGVTLTVMNIETNVPIQTVTDAKGVFATQDLVPGRYRIVARLQGFKRYVRDGVVLRTAETATVNIVLDLGAIEETVTVTAGLSEVESNQSVLSQAMENRAVSELPLDGRQVYMLLQLTTGTLFTQEQFGATGFSGTRAWDVNGAVTIHGSRTGNNEFLIDGAPNSGTGGWSYSPPVEAIQEFKVDTASTDAQYGRTSGGVVSLTLRSGTNQLRGSETMLVRGTALDANQIQNIKNSTSNRDHRYIDAEGTLSGPIVRNKTFFMGGYQGFYEDIPFPRSSTVPTDLQRQGDFSRTFNAAGQPVIIYDPLTTRADPARPGRFIRDPFPDNKLPVDRMNPVALALLSAMPRSNAPGTITGANNYYASPSLGHYRYNSYLSRIDHHVSERQRLSVSHSANWGSERRSENGLPPPALRSDNWPTHRNHLLVTLDDTLTLSSSTVLSTRASFDRFNEPHPKDLGPVDHDLGFRTPYQVTAVPWYPNINIGGETDMFSQGFRQTTNNIYGVQSKLSTIAGTHLVKVGAEFRMYNLIRRDVGDANGTFSFNSGFTQRDPQAGSSIAGNGVASFLLGLPSGGGVDVNFGSDQRYANYSAFVQDDWKISPKATLSLGLRWDYQAPLVEKDDRQVVGFDATSLNPFQPAPGTMNAATERPLGPLVGGVLFAGTNGQSRSPYKGDFDNIQPRATFAYKLARHVSARANYGRSYLGLTACCGGLIQTGFNRTTPLVTTGPQIGVPFRYLDSPFPEPFLQPIGNSMGLATNVGQGISFRNPDFKVPYTDQWMAGVNVDLPWQIGMNIAYVGNRISGLPMNLDRNLFPLAEQMKAIERLGGNAAYLSTQIPNPFAGLLPGTGLNNATTRRDQLLRPFPQFTGITENFLNIGRARYRALEISTNKRFSRGLQMGVNYTWSRRLEATSRLNAWDAQPFEDISGNDRPHRVTITALYMLPFGPRERFGANTTGALAQLISGWQYNVIGEIQSGGPIGLNGGAIPLQDHFALPAGEQSLGKWFDNSTRTNPRPDGTYAWDLLLPNDFRVAPFYMKDVRGPARPNWGMSLFKSLPLGGGKKVQLRGEMFNVLNMRAYPGPNTNPASANFGQVGGGAPDQMNFPRRSQLGLRFTF